MDAERHIAGRYRLAEVIGSGGMGVVWRATDIELGRPVALKRAREPGDPEELTRMRREARHTGSLRHEHVVTLYDLVVDDGPWLVMEYVPSSSLAEMIKTGPLDPSRAARIGAQVAEALAEAHHIGLVHRDVKPGNVLFSRLANGGARDHIKLTDFGISRRAYNATLTDTGGSGTPAYMSPEVTRDEPATPASDVFSLGSTVYAAAFGSPPFGADGNPLMIMRRVEACQVEIPRGTGPLGPVLATLLARDPADRPTATRAAALLRAAAGDAPPPPEVEVPGRSRWPLAAAGVTAIVAAAAVAVVVVATRAEPAGAPPTDPATQARPTATAAIAGLGDIRTADPCALVDPAPLRRFGDGNPTLDADYSGFARCDLLVEPASGNQVDVQIVLSPSADPQPDVAGDIGVGTPIKGTENDEKCEWHVRLPDKNQVSATAQQYDGGSVDRCTMAEIAIQSAIAILRRGEVTRRAAPFPPNSLAHLNACELPSAAALARVPGINPAAPDPGFANWECSWDGAQHYNASVLFDRNAPYNDTDGTLVTVGGRPARVESGGKPDDGYCKVKVTHRRYLDDRKMEVVIVEVGGPAPPEQLCVLAKALAAPVAEKLPAP